MKVLILYRPNSEHDTLVTGWAREYQHRTSRELEMLSLDSREGAETARMYDIVQYPALIAIADNGMIQKAWQGTQLPLISEVSYYDSL